MASVFYVSTAEIATVSNTFKVNGTATDPTTVSLTITTPSGAATTYTYAASQITKTSTGLYTKDITCSEAGTWSYLWEGTGAASDAEAGTWTVFPDDLRQQYASLENLKLALSITDTNRDVLLRQALASAARSIDNYTHRRFYLDASTSARTYRPDRRTRWHCDGDELLVDDIATTTGLIVEVGTALGSTWSTVTEYEALPENAVARGVPITSLLRVRVPWTYGQPWTRIRVTARWGWLTVPDVVAQATLLQAARLYRRKDSPEGVLGSAEWGLMRVARLDPDVKAMLRPLILPTFA
jgi:hypothetical protein